MVPGAIIFYKNYFIDFYKEQNDKVKKNINKSLEYVKTVEIIPEDIFKHIENSNGLYEVRVKQSTNIYRIFCCFDKGNIVVLFNAFQKKTQKTPKEEIERAEKLKNEYFNEKTK